MNCYVLYCLATKVEQLCNIFNGINGIHAYIPKIEEGRSPPQLDIQRKTGMIFIGA